MNTLGLEFWFKFIISDFFDKIPVRILLDVLFNVFRFSKVSFNALASSFTTIYKILKLGRHLGTETYRRLPGQF